MQNLKEGNFQFVSVRRIEKYYARTSDWQHVGRKESRQVIDAAIVGLGWWGRYIVSSLQGKSDRIRFVRAIDTVRANIEAFASAVEGGLPYPVATDEMAHNIAVLEAIVDSAESGKPVGVK